MSARFASAFLCLLLPFGTFAQEPPTKAKTPVIPVTPSRDTNEDEVRKLRIEQADNLMKVLLAIEDGLVGKSSSRYQPHETFKILNELLEVQLKLQTDAIKKQQVLEEISERADFYRDVSLARSDIETPVNLPIARAGACEFKIRLVEFNRQEKLQRILPPLPRLMRGPLPEPQPLPGPIPAPQPKPMPLPTPMAEPKLPTLPPPMPPPMPGSVAPKPAPLQPPTSPATPQPLPAPPLPATTSDSIFPGEKTDGLRRLRIERHDAIVRVIEVLDERQKDNPNSQEREIRSEYAMILLDIRAELKADAALMRQTIQKTLEDAKLYEKIADARGELEGPNKFSMAKLHRIEVEIRLAEFNKTQK